MGRYSHGGKTEADSLKKILISQLKAWGYFNRRYNGLITWTSGWSETKSSVSISVYLSEHDAYLRIWYTQANSSTEEKTDFDYHIPLVSTPCNLGGKRYWFICPWYRNGFYCGRRVATLYLGGERFACRHCYDLSYASRNENRRGSFFHLGQALDKEDKIEKLEEKLTTKFYMGRPTRKYKRILKLQRRCYGSYASINWKKLGK